MFWRLPAALLAFSSFALAASVTYAAGSVLIWPVDPVIEYGQTATGIWLENRSTEDALIQLRVFAWEQKGGEDSYSEQTDIVGTPPMVRIPAGQKQMLRLTQTKPTPAATERAYRILIDEIPTPETHNPASTTSAGVRFQFRYSIPLFTYGEGLWRKNRPEGQRRTSLSNEPALTWKMVEDDKGKWLEISNNGLVHARLTQAALHHAEGATPLGEGLIGYVLAGRSLRKPWPQGLATARNLSVHVNTRPEAVMLPSTQ